MQASEYRDRLKPPGCMNPSSLTNDNACKFNSCDQAFFLCDTVHACIMGPAAAGDGEAAEGHGHGGAGAHALLEEALAPVLALDPLRAGGGCDHQEGRDHAAREGDHLQTSNRVHTRIELAL